MGIFKVPIPLLLYFNGISESAMQSQFCNKTFLLLIFSSKIKKKSFDEDPFIIYIQFHSPILSFLNKISFKDIKIRKIQIKHHTYNTKKDS